MNVFLDVIAFPFVLMLGVLPCLLLIALVVIITLIVRHVRNKKK